MTPPLTWAVCFLLIFDYQRCTKLFSLRFGTFVQKLSDQKLCKKRENLLWGSYWKICFKGLSIEITQDGKSFN